VNLLVQDSAETDIARHAERYAEQALPLIAKRFHSAVLTAIDALVAMPEAGPPRPGANSALSGLRAWPVKGFDGFWIYYLVDARQVTVVRILHGKRDIGIILDVGNTDGP
jgi:plasmid stabilization system protein ParE